MRNHDMHDYDNQRDDHGRHEDRPRHEGRRGHEGHPRYDGPRPEDRGWSEPSDYGRYGREDRRGPRRGERFDSREDRRGPGGYGGRPGGRGGRGGRGDGAFGPDGPFGADGPFGPGGPFGAGGSFGPGFFSQFGPAAAQFAAAAMGEQGFGSGRGGRPGPGRGHRGGRRARRGDVRLAALLLIAEQPMNGYQIIEALADRTDDQWRPSPGAIYPALSQLEDEGLIEAVTEDGRKAYRLTEAGRTEVDSLSDRPKPWAFAEESAQESRARSEHHANKNAPLWKAIAQTGLAAHAVSQAGDEHIIAAAVDILDDAKKALYRLLADETTRDDSDENRDDDTSYQGEIIEGELVNDGDEQA